MKIDKICFVIRIAKRCVLGRNTKIDVENVVFLITV